jgi:hypothetical protein
MDDESQINDVREYKIFKGITFSKFKKVDVKKELLNSLMNSKIEPTCYWSAELVCSGHFNDLWEIIIFFYTKYIHLGNTKISIYIELRLNQFKEILNTGYLGNELSLRNNQKIRHLFCEIMCILCDAKRKHSFDNIKVGKNDFDMVQLRDKFKAPNNKFAENILKERDPKELYPAINEIAYCISEQGKNIMNACYWFEWIIEFENMCMIKKEKLICERRNYSQIESKLQMDVIWIVWEVFFIEAEKRSQIITKIIKSLFTLFSLKYTKNCSKKRKYIFYFAISLFCENINISEEIMRPSQQEIIKNIIKKINLVYAQIKKNEESPGTDYLFKNIKSNNLEKTIEKLEKMNTFGENFIPRL